MGFRTGAYAKIWEVQPRTPSVTTLRVSTSKKPKGSDEYVQDFSGFVSCVGSTAAEAAKGLKAGDVIKLGDVDVTTTYVKEKQKEYTNFACFSFEKVEWEKKESKPVDEFDPTDVPDGAEDEGLPF